MEVDKNDTQNEHNFRTFPPEIWNKILEHVDETAGIVAVFQVFQHLENLSRRQQFSWLIGKILPYLLIKHLTFADMKTLRLVSKRWKNALDSFLETHSDRLPYQNPGGTHNLKPYHISKIAPDMVTNFRLLSRKCELSCLKETYNPFPGRYVRIRVTNRCRELARVIPALKYIGSHIHYVEMVIRFPDLVSVKDHKFFLNVILPLLQCLSYLPNLRSLKLGMKVGSMEKIERDMGKKYTNFIAAFPLPFRLESLDISGYEILAYGAYSIVRMHWALMKALANHDHVQTLVVKYPFWPLQKSFPNLSQLCLISFDKSGMKSVLKNLKNSPIRKLRLKEPKLSLDDILNIVLPYNIQSLDLSGGFTDSQNEGRERSAKIRRLRNYFGQNAGARRSRETLSSIRCLSLDTSPWLAYSCLETLENLEYLTLRMSYHSWRIASHFNGIQNMNSEETFNMSLHKFYYDDEVVPENVSFVWKMLPNLKMLTILRQSRPVGGVTCYQYDLEFPTRVLRSSCFVKMI